MQWLGTSLFIYMPIIFFVYGMSFFMLGIAIAVEHITINITTSSFKRFIFSPVGSLSIFGLIHGSVELMDMFFILNGGAIMLLKIIRLFLMATSFYFLFRFGVYYSNKAVRDQAEDETSPEPAGILKEIYSRNVTSRIDFPKIAFGVWFILVVLIFFYEGSGDKWFNSGEVLSRYLIALPGSLIVSLSLLRFRKESASSPDKYQTIASVSFVFYAIFSGLIVPKTDLYPATVINYESFYSIAHMPVQFFRSICAIVIAVALFKFFKLSKELSAIKFKAIFYVFISVLIPLFIIILFVSYMIAESLLNLSYRENEKRALLISERVLSFFEDAGERVRYYASFSQLASASAERDIFMSLVGSDADINGIAFIDGNKEIFSLKRDPGSRGIKYKGDGDRIRIKNFLADFIASVPFNSFSIEGHSDGNILMGIPFMKKRMDVLIYSDRLYETLLTMKVEKGWHTLLIDDKGGIVMPRRKERLGEEEFREHLFVPAKDWKTIREKNTFYYAIKEKIPATGWSVVLEIPRDEIAAPVFRVFRVLLAGVLGVCLTAIVLALIFVEEVANPLNVIAQKVKMIGKGDLEQKIDIRTGDELQTLAEEIEKMAASLKENKEMEERMVQTEKMASLGHLTAGIAHEVNNPLGIILGYCQVMLREVEPDNRYYADLKTIEKHVLSCKVILEDLLKFSRPYRKVDMEVDTNTNIREALALIPKHFLREKVNIVLEMSNSSPKIMGDPDKLHQLFLNLTMNALDAMKEGGKLLVTTRIFSSKSGAMVEIVFSDTGSGIREEDLGKIFDPFFTTKEVGKGTGLGLSVSYGIVKEHGGEIWAESILGKGTTFHIIFRTKNSYEQ